ncbi:hypothetical protein ABPG74_022185 [Tetrahymena malaccensis]
MILYQISSTHIKACQSRSIRYKFIQFPRKMLIFFYIQYLPYCRGSRNKKQAQNDGDKLRPIRLKSKISRNKVEIKYQRKNIQKMRNVQSSFTEPWIVISVIIIPNVDIPLMKVYEENHTKHQIDWRHIRIANKKAFYDYGDSKYDKECQRYSKEGYVIILFIINNQVNVQYVIQ